MTSKWRLDQQWMSRRALLGGLGIGGLGASGALALLPPEHAAAQSVPKRFIVVHVPEGMWDEADRPSAGDDSLGSIFGPLDDFRDRLTVLDGLDMVSRRNGPGGDGHHRGVPHMLTCTEMADDDNAGGPSIDQKIAQAIGGDTPFPSLQFAVRIIYGDTNAALIWAAERERLPAMQNPWEAYERIFSDQAEQQPAASAAPRYDLRKSTLDNAVAELNALRNRLPAGDRARLESYHQSLRDIERRLESLGAPGACAMPELGPEVEDVKQEDLYPQIGQLQMDLMVSALCCNVTNVASFQWGNSNDQCSYPWLGVNTLGHRLAHDGGTAERKQKVYNWYSQQFAYLLGQLDAVPEGAGSMLDNTTVLWVSEFGDSGGHSDRNLLWLLMGNAGGFFKQGQVLKMDGRSCNDVHATLGNAFGIQDQTFGNPEYSDGPIDALRA